MLSENIKRSLLIAIIVVIGLAVGFIIERQISEKNPLPLEFLANPIVDKLYANAEGTVVAKTEDSMTLEKNGRQITMFIEERVGLTTFFLEQNQSIQISFNEVNVGDNLVGGVSIVLSPQGAIGLPNRNIGDVIAHRFSVSR
ncbi:hypothetical protein HYW19_03625 [Candidatus Woesearchaeota archaeon]|nr:hypothetical protein [Candidatus Woesearchaeota archaeon]